MTDVQHRVALVTGAARRLGRALAVNLGRQGWTIAAHVHRIDADAHSLIEELTALGISARMFEADLAVADDVDTLVPAVALQLGHPTCLINNASVFTYDDAKSITSQSWEQHFSVNAKAPVFLARGLAAGLPEDGTSGVVINIIDQRVWKPTPHFLSYAGSKATLWAMTQTLAQGLAPRVRVNAIGPGPMLRSVHQSKEEFDAQCAATPLQRATTTDDVAAAIRFIIDAQAMTGQMIALDGGQHLSWKTPDIGDGRG